MPMWGSEQSLTVVIKARDEASEKVRATGKTLGETFGSVYSWTRLVGAIVLIRTGAELAASAMTILGAASEMAAARASHNVRRMADSAVSYLETLGHVARVVPLIGTVLEQVVNTLNNLPGMKQLQADLKAIEERTVRINKLTDAAHAAMRTAYAATITDEMERARYAAQGEAESSARRIKDVQTELDNAKVALAEIQKAIAEATPGLFGQAMALIPGGGTSGPSVELLARQKAAVAALADAEAGLAEQQRQEQTAAYFWGLAMEERAGAQSKKLIEEMNKWFADRKEARKKYYDFTQTAGDREVRELADQKAEMMAIAKKYGLSEEAVTIAFMKKRRQSEDDEVAKSAAVKDKYFNFVLKDQARELKAVEDEKEAMLEIARKYGLDQSEIYKAAKDKEAEINQRYTAKAIAGITPGGKLQTGESRFLTRAGLETPGWANILNANVVKQLEDLGDIKDNTDPKKNPTADFTIVRI